MRADPNVKDRIRVLDGSLEYANLGIINERTFDDLIEECEIVIHSAANVSFIDPMEDLIRVNLLGTQNLLEKCKDMQSLRTFVHISTAFSQMNHAPIVEEKFYEPMIDAKDFIRKLGQLREDCDSINFNFNMPKFIGPNHVNYTATKNAAEALVKSYENDFRVVVIRPSIGNSTQFHDNGSSSNCLLISVMPTYREPIPCWYDKLQLSTSIPLAIMSGCMRTSQVPKGRANFVFADLIVNSTLAIIWHSETTDNEKAKVFNIGSHFPNITNGLCRWLIESLRCYRFQLFIPAGYAELLCSRMRKLQLTKSFWYPTMMTFNKRYTYAAAHVLFEVIPSLIFDVVFPNKPFKCLTVCRSIFKSKMARIIGSVDCDFVSENIRGVSAA